MIVGFLFWLQFFTVIITILIYVKYFKVFCGRKSDL